MKKPRTTRPARKQLKREPARTRASHSRAAQQRKQVPLPADAAAARPPGWRRDALAMAVARARALPRRRGRGAPDSVEQERELLRQLFAPAKPAPMLAKALQQASIPQMAMDENLSWAGNMISSALAEGVTFMGYPQLAEMAQRPEYRVISEVIAEEMTRKWIKLKVDGDATEDVEGEEEEDTPPPVTDDPAIQEQLDLQQQEKDQKAQKAAQKLQRAKAKRVKQLQEEMKRLDVQGVFRRIAEQDGFFGRAHLYIDTGDGDNADELKLSIGDGSPNDAISKRKFKRGKLVALRTVEPVWTYPINYNSNDPLAVSWYNPQTWFVMGKEVHSTRLLKFVGREVPDLLKPAYSFGGLSLSQMAKPYVDNWLDTRQSVADLIRSFTIFSLKTNMQSALTADGDEFYKRLDLFTTLRNNQAVMALDVATKEELTNISAPLGTLDALQAQTQEHMAAVSRIPLVKLLGIQPAGLNASSDGEIRVFYDTIHSQQRRLFDANLRTVINFIQLSLWGEVDPSITWEWEPLWSLDEKALADKRKVEADTAAVYYEMGSVDSTEVRETLANDPDSPYAGLDLSKPVEQPEQEQDEDQLFDEDGEDPQAGLQRTLKRAGAKPPGGKPPGNNNRAGGGQREDRTGGAPQENTDA